MEEKKTLKISLTAIIIVIAVIIGAIIIMTIKMNVDKIKAGSNEIKRNSLIEQNTEKENTEVNPPEQGTTTAIAYTDFDFNFLKIENQKKNMIYSPLSIKYALNMLREGAGGNTKTQIDNVLKNTSITKYNNIDKVLSLANGLYIRDRYNQYVKNDFKNTLINKYNAEINQDTFQNANNINRWIENKTLGIIKNMVKDELVQNPNMEMILVNALAIDMEWKNTFEVDETNGQEFNLADGNKMIATTMNKETSSNNISYYKDENVTALTMDLKEYGDTQFEFMAIMPKENLSGYIDRFTKQDLDKIANQSKLASNTPYGVKISIPKFKFNYDLELKEDLKKMGITEAFDENKADFSNMSSKELWVSEALHKADIDFSEKGVKAAAVTVIMMMDGAMIEDPTKPEEIRIDRPFMYVIRDKKTREIWFVGTVYEPNAWDNDKEDYQAKW